MPDKTEPPEPAPDGQILIYQDGATRLQVRLDGRTVWLTQGLIAELFQTTTRPSSPAVTIRWPVLSKATLLIFPI